MIVAVAVAFRGTAQQEDSVGHRPMSLQPIDYEVPQQKPIAFVTAETRGGSLLERVGNFHEEFKTSVTNLGTGKPWKGFKTKVELLAAYLRSQIALVGYTAPGTVEEELMAFMDGSDVMWGGCNSKAFRRAYEQIAKRSGASIIFSAELVCGEQDCNKVPEVPRWAEDQASGRNLSTTFWRKYAVGCNGTWSDECSARRDCGYWAPCATPPAVKFLNSGFFIGPIKDLSEMMEWSLKHYEMYSVWGDQSVFAAYWLENPERVTLDYTGDLALSLSDLSHGVLAAERHSKVWNAAFERTQCLVHGNGRGRPFLRELVKIIEGKSLEDVRGY